ncbi:MAG: adenylosuccinate lyase [Bacteroidales bacterium]
MDFNSLTALSPVDGRYRQKTDELAEYLSEYALMKYRTMVEVEYFIALCRIPLPQLKDVDTDKYDILRSFYREFGMEDAEKIKEYERTTNHDVKALEYFLKEKFTSTGFGRWKEFVHFGLTSQDINNTALPLSVRDAMAYVYTPLLFEIRETLAEMSEKWKNVPMLARTHGQPASPTRVGKEIAVFISRLDEQIKYFSQIPFSAKFGGATGNLNAHKAAYPGIDWNAFADNFVNEILGLKRSFPTTQIEHYDNLAALFDNIKRINVILTDLARDIWMYISMDYFRQKTRKGEVGSSAMPHKVNPIDFENAEGNLGIANTLFCHMSEKLPVSRLQRDLTDSTVSRNIGVAFGHTLVAFGSILKGMSKLVLNETRISSDLENNWVVITEAIQTILRREGHERPYEMLLELTRKEEQVTREVIINFIDNLDVDEEIKKELKAISPFNYTGI